MCFGLATDNCYTLQNNADGSVVFAKITSALTYPYGRAYLKLSGTRAPQSLAVNFDGATGIGEAGREEAERVYYNLSGVRVQNPTRGLYIRNGKKVLIK